MIKNLCSINPSGNNIDFITVDLPLPDSPTIPKISFLDIKANLLTALTIRSLERKLTLKFCIEISGLEEDSFKTNGLLDYIVSFINICIKIF